MEDLDRTLDTDPTDEIIGRRAAGRDGHVYLIAGWSSKDHTYRIVNVKDKLDVRNVKPEILMGYFSIIDEHGTSRYGRIAVQDMLIDWDVENDGLRAQLRTAVTKVRAAFYYTEAPPLTQEEARLIYRVLIDTERGRNNWISNL